MDVCHGRQAGDKPMFSVKIKYGSGKSFAVTTPVMADRLPEAEAVAVGMLNRVFPDFEVVMIHRDDLEYHVYRIDEPIAIVNIKTGGDNVEHNTQSDF